ncbi:MAG: hypothetical protein KAH33_05135 [Candidatus Delongbacteria bacterium]|nr:hypothetical protein [Candidatus Delongbacteria bacterium]
MLYDIFEDTKYSFYFSKSHVKSGKQVSSSWEPDIEYYLNTDLVPKVEYLSSLTELFDDYEFESEENNSKIDMNDGNNAEVILLIEEIKADTINSKMNIASVMRKCKILSLKVGNKDFHDWVEKELSGFKLSEEVPDYRKLSVVSKGDFRGYDGSSLTNTNIPMLSLPPEYRGTTAISNIRNSISSVENVLSEMNSGSANEPWNSDFVALLGDKIYKDMVCLQAWKVIPKGLLIGLLDEVKNKILNFILEIEHEIQNKSDIQANSKESGIQSLLSDYPNVLSLYNSAIEKYSSSLFKRNLLDDFRLCLECLLKDILKNKKTLENQIDILGKYLKDNGTSPALRGTFRSLLNHFIQYQNDNVKHADDDVNYDEIELIKDQTESFIKYLIKLIGKK